MPLELIHELEKVSCHALVVGIAPYGTNFCLLKRTLPAYVAEHHHTDLAFEFDFEMDARVAWAFAQTTPHDIYFIDGKEDNYVRSGRVLSEALRELYPSRYNRRNELYGNLSEKRRAIRSCYSS